MLRDSENQALLALLDAVKGTLPGFVEWPAQTALAAAIASTFAGNAADNTTNVSGYNLAVCEAPTGTGETVAMGAAGLVLAHSRRKRLIFSSSSVLLQAQLLHRDMPFLIKLFSQPMTLAIAKGRQRYVCNLRLQHALDQASQPQLDLPTDHRASDPGRRKSSADLALLTTLSSGLENGSWCGDRDAWKGTIDDHDWNELTTDRHGCASRRCSKFASCAFFIARQKVRDANVVICNHDLLLSSLDMERGSVLPPAAESFYLIDEGHRLPDKATEHFGARYALGASQTWLTDLATSARRCVLGINGERSAYDRIASAVASLIEGTNRIVILLRLHQQQFNEHGYWRFPNGNVPESLAQLT